MIYRVLFRSTGVNQTFSPKTTVTYCGTDLQQARIHYLRSKALDHKNEAASRETVIEAFESSTDDIADATMLDPKQVARKHGRPNFQSLSKALRSKQMCAVLLMPVSESEISFPASIVGAEQLSPKSEEKAE